jgi:hypothetical protein
MATQYSNKPIVTDGLVYALDFGNQKSYVSGSATAQSLIYRPTPARFETLLPGDYGTPAAAYSVRKVVSSYTGSAMMVQSASVSQSIGFDANGNLDTASLASFAGSGDAFVKIWFDQSGNNNHASQSVFANQPRIVNSGAIILNELKPAIEQTGSQLFNVNNVIFTDLFVVLKVNTQATINYFIGQSTGGLFANGTFGGVNGLGGADNLGNVRSSDGEDFNRHLGYFNMSSGKLNISKDGSVLSNVGNFASSMTLIRLLGQTGGPLTLLGNAQEFIFYNSNQSSNRLKIEDNINRYFNIFTPTLTPIPNLDNDFLDFTDESILQTQQSFSGFSYDQGNSTIMYVGETKGNSTTFTQDGTLSIVSTTSSVGFGSPSNTFGRSYPVTGLKHVTLRFSSGSVDCFVNGIPVSASAIFPTGSTIGGGQLNIPLYTGSLGGFQIYNRPLTSDEIWNNYQLTAPRYGLGPVQNKPYTLDENAYLFLQSAGITDPIITGSIDTFVRGLKSASLWDKMIAIYPFVGTGSTGINLTGSHRWNLKEPSLVTYPLTFTGSWIGSTSGSAPSGSGTNITMGGVTPTTVYPFYNTQSAHISILSYDTPVSSSYLMGTGMTEDLAVSTLAGDYGTPAAAYSVRKVRTAYSGALMDVRRSLDNVTSSIGYVSNGDLDTGSLLNFVRTEGSSYLPGAYSGLAAAYSLRRVSASYDGPAIDVRRSYDNITGSVGFDSNGNLNTASLFTFVNVSENLLPYSQDLAKTGSSPNFLDGWASANLQVTASTIIAPDGTLTGNTVTTTSSFHYLASRISGSYQNQQMIFSFWAKTGSMTAAALSVYDITNAANIIAPTSYYSQITSGQWTYITASFTVPSNCIYFQVYPLRDSGVTGSIYIWGAQLRTSSYVDGYVRTTGSKATPGPVVFGTASHSFGYVNTWYDQSGNGRHATQTATGSQPLIVSSGSLVTENGKPAIRFDGVNDSLIMAGLHGQSVLDQYFVTSTSDTVYIYPNSAGGTPFGFEAESGNFTDGRGSSYGTGILYANGVETTGYTRDDIYNVTVGYKTVVHQGADTSGWSSYEFGARAGFTYSGSLQELIAYTSSQAANRTLIENNINNYYNIYTGSNHGFVARWYDQSGNNRHASQTATGSQPLIVESGSLIFENSKPTMQFDGVDDILYLDSTFSTQFEPSNSEISVFAAGKRQNTASNTFIFGVADNTDSDPANNDYIAFGTTPITTYGQITSRDYTGAFNSKNATSDPNAAGLNQYLYSGIRTSTVGTAYINGLSTGSADLTHPTLQLHWATLGGIVRGSVPVGIYAKQLFQEIIIYPNNQSSTREPIEYNINNYYNIYPQTSSFATSSFTIQAGPTSVSASLNNRLTSGISTSGPLGLITVSRTGSNSLTIARNGVTSSFAVPASGALSTGIYLGAINNNGIAVGNSPVNISFASVGTGLTNSQIATYSNLVNTLRFNINGINQPEYINVLLYAANLGYTLPSIRVQVAQNRLISDLKAAGIWNKLDTFGVFATDGSSNFALVDWKRLTQYTPVNNPTFTPNIGFSGNGINTYIDLNYNPFTSGVNYTQNNASYGCLVDGISGTATGLMNTSGNSIIRSNMMLNLNIGRNGINGGSGQGFFTNTKGLNSNDRSNASNFDLLENGSVTSTHAISSTSMPTAIRVMYGYTFYAPSTMYFNAVYAGASLRNEQSSFYTALNTYYSSISS